MLTKVIVQDRNRHNYTRKNELIALSQDIALFANDKLTIVTDKLTIVTDKLTIVTDKLTIVTDKLTIVTSSLKYYQGIVSALFTALNYSNNITNIYV